MTNRETAFPPQDTLTIATPGMTTMTISMDHTMLTAKGGKRVFWGNFSTYDTGQVARMIVFPFQRDGYLCA